MKTSGHRGWIAFDLGFVLCAAAIFVAVFIGTANRMAAPQTPPPPPPPPTEQQVADECIKSMIAWVERIGPVGRDWNQAQRREALGWFLYRVAELGNADATFHGQRDFACEALEAYFPEIECWACEN